MQTSVLEQLKALVHSKTQRDWFPFQALESGIPRGAITEISGFGKTEFVADFLAEHPELRVAWLEENFTVFPFGFLQKNIDLHRILFVDAGTDIGWASLQTLRSQYFSIVVIGTENLELALARKIQLASEKANAATLLLTVQPLSLYPISLQVQVHRAADRVQGTVLKRRH